MQISEEAPLEDYNDALDEIDELAEQWKNRFSVNNTRFVERYLKCEMGIGIEMSFKKDRSKKLIAIFERKGRLLVVDRGGRTTPCNKELYVTEGGAGRDDSTVFVDDVELIQLPEGIPLASTIRLQSANDFFRLGANSLEEGKSLRFRQPGSVPSYWEVDILENAWIGNPGADDECHRETIQCTSQVMDSVSNNGTPCLGDGFIDADFENLYRGFRIFIHNDFIRISPPIGFDLSDKLVKVFFGPCNFYPATEQRVIVHEKAS